MADKKQAQEAIARINTLVRQCGLNPKIAKYFNEGKIYYSYLTAGGLMGSIDTITYDPKYAEAVRQFESLFRGSKVYHAIETKTGFGTMLSLLYVSADEGDWPGERLEGNEILAYVCNVDDPDESEIGYIRVEGFGGSGALVRVG